MASRDHMMGWPAAMLLLDEPYAGKSYGTTPAKVQMDARSENVRREIDKRNMEELSAKRMYEWTKGLVIGKELRTFAAGTCTTKVPVAEQSVDPVSNRNREKLEEWQASVACTLGTEPKTHLSPDGQSPEKGDWCGSTYTVGERVQFGSVPYVCSHIVDGKAHFLIANAPEENPCKEHMATRGEFNGRHFAVGGIYTCGLGDNYRCHSVENGQAYFTLMERQYQRPKKAVTSSAFEQELKAQQAASVYKRVGDALKESTNTIISKYLTKFAEAPY